MDRVTRLAGQNAVVIFSVSSCCMCHAIKRFFYELGVNPAIHELDQDAKGREMEKELVNAVGRRPGLSGVPVVFVGGRLIGSTDQVMNLHLSGQLVPLLKREGALWL